MSTSNTPAGHPENRRPAMALKNIIEPSVFLLVLVGAYFACAGRLNVILSWVYFVILLSNSVILTILMDPSLIEERARRTADRKETDLPYAMILGRIGPIVIIIISGLDTRFGWTNMNMRVASIIAAAIMVLGLLLTDWAVLKNRFFSSVVRIQKDRGHKAVTDGPYRYIRHPGYCGSMIYILTTAIILRSVWALIPAIAVVISIVLRTANEDRILDRELEGYREYSEKTKYRLIPYIW